MATTGMSSQTLQTIWASLPSNIRRKAAEAFWRDPAARSEHEQAIAELARRLHTREVKLRRSGADKLSLQLSSFSQIPEEVAEAVFRAYFLAHHRPMMRTFLELLGIPHVDSQFETDSVAPPSRPSLLKAVETLRQQFAAEHVDLYIAVLQAQDFEFWRALSEAQESPKPAALVERATQGERPGQSTLPPPVSQVAEDFTVIDEVTKATIDAWASGVQGALNIEQVTSMVTELVQCNAQRHRSYFHCGYLDVLQDNPPEPHFRGENLSRRLWYLCGVVVAFERRRRTADLVTLFDQEDLKPFGRELVPRSRFAVQAIFEALCEEGRAGTAAKFLAPPMVTYASLFDVVLEWGTKLLRASKVEDATALLDVLDSSLPYIRSGDIAPERLRQLQRRRAHCLRLKHDFQGAIRILTRLLQDPELEAQSVVKTDLAMSQAGFRGLFDLIIPPDEKQIGDFCRRLQAIQADVASAMELPGEKAHASYCLGVLALAESVIGRQDPRSAVVYLEPAVTYMASRGENYVIGDLLKRADFYLALALAQTLDDTRLGYAAERFANSILAGFSPPGYLLRRFMESLAVADPERAKDAAELALSQLQLRGSTLESLLTAEVARRSDVIWNALFEWAGSESHSRSKRFRDFSVLLREAISAQNLPAGERALDALEQLATEGVCVPDFVGMMRDSASYDPIWTLTEATWAAVHVLERAGRYREAAQLLREEFYRRLWSDEFSARDEAEDVLQRIKAYGSDELTVNELTKALEAFQHAQEFLPPQAIAPDKAIPVCITVVGGDELQARFDSDIEATVSNASPGIELHFQHTNWSSNWGDQFEAMKPLLKRSDAVVVLRLIRTNLGRTVRAFSPLWIGCSGRSPSSIVRAVELAAELARKAKSKR